LEPSLIDNFKPENYFFYGELKKLGISYENVVLELKEDEISDTAKLKLFCDRYRALGFNIAINDFGVGQSSFDRITVVRPDIIKIDRSLITDISNNQIHREIVSAICKMCHNIGAIPPAEGSRI
jgi:EAL domain-containing protein (putative c-di-GMP-specific phosphodiesterase class I)